MMKPYYGLTGTKLNIAIATIAGIDFALFGYDQVCDVLNPTRLSPLIQLGCYGRAMYVHLHIKWNSDL
jgi:hypothetical protein